MSRFDHLEFEPGKPPVPSSQPSTRQFDQEVHDEHHWMHQADLERRVGHWEEALRYYSRALELNKSLVGGWLGQVQMLIALGEYPEAELWGRKANEIFHNHQQLVAAQAHALVRRGSLSQAQALCDRALALEGNSEYPWIVRGELMLARRDPIEQHCFDKARQLSSDWLVLVEIAGIYMYHRRPAKALSLFRQAVVQAPDNAYCWFCQGKCELELGLAFPAQRSLTHCLELAPGHVEAKRCLERATRQKWSPLTIVRRLFSS
jgi:tetratricopeptide (TPR) repeat protein